MINKKEVIAILMILLLPSVFAAVVWSPETSAGITVSGGPFCSDGGTNWDDGVTITPSADSCHRDDGFPSESCCLDGFYCDYPGTNECKENPLDISQCSHATPYGQSVCEGLSYDIAVAGIEQTHGEGFCTSIQESTNCPVGVVGWIQISDCACKWENSECVETWAKTDSCDSSNDGYCVIGDEVVDDKCEDDGTYTLTWTASWYDLTNTLITDPALIDDDCESGSESFDCGSVARLAFVTTTTIVIIVVLIIVIYYALSKGKRGAKKKGGK